MTRDLHSISGTHPAGPAFNRHRLDPPLRGISGRDYAANFEAFLEARDPDQPFCFWYGGFEPHRSFEEGAGIRSGKRLEDVKLPAYYPDSDVIRSDLLDHSLEVEWFDRQLTSSHPETHHLSFLSGCFLYQMLRFQGSVLADSRDGAVE